MKPYTDKHLRRKRGIAIVWMAVAMPPMMAMVGLALDMGNVAIVRSRFQNFADAKALSALKEKFGGLPKQVTVEDYVGGIFAGKQQPEAKNGIYDFKSSTFTETTNLFLQPLQVPARRVALDFEVPLLFGPIVGVKSVTIQQSAVAYLGQRQIVIVQDVSGSMAQGSRMPNAKQADTNLINEMALTQKIAGDQVGLVAFDDVIKTNKPLTALANGGHAALTSIVAGWSPGAGTNISLGINAGAKLFPEPHGKDVERIMIVVGDGEDCNFTGSVAEVDAAEKRDIHVFTIMITGGGAGGGMGGCDNGGGPEKYFAQLPRGRGTYKDSPDGGNLDKLVKAIVAGIPLHLVQ
jgi:Flp pilus assembly protein TadG